MANTTNELETPVQEPEQVKEYPVSRVRGRKSPRFKAALVGGIAVAVVVIVVWWLHAAAWESTDDAQVDAHIYAISSRISGHVVKVNVDDNDVVKAGDVLVEIDPADYEVTKQRYEAELADAKANAES